MNRLFWSCSEPEGAEEPEKARGFRRRSLSGRILTLALTPTLLLLLSVCSPRIEESRDGWLVGTSDDRFDRIEDHLRGLDMAMVEIGYRFSELYFAGRDENWPYARYQAEKIDQSLRLALERRPAREPSARPFLERDLPALLKAVESADQDVFLESLERLRQSCNTCHAREEVPSFVVEFPEHRSSTIRLP